MVKYIIWRKIRKKTRRKEIERIIEGMLLVF